MKKYLVRGGLAIATMAVVLGGAAAFSAFEAHVVNVTATIENATTMDTTPLTFGDMFPQEIRLLPETISLSDSFLSDNNTRATSVDYVIKQKPKCGLPIANTNPTQYSAYEQVTEDANGIFSCPDSNYAMLPLLCPYLSKTSSTPGDTSVPSFHGATSTPEWTDAISTQTQAVGHLDKTGATSTTWQINLHTPCFKNQCAQDWADFVHIANPDANAAAYMADPANEHQEYGCDLWYEVSAINESQTPPPPTTAIHFIKVLCPSYNVIAGNAFGGDFDNTGGNFTQFTNYNASSSPVFPNPYTPKPINPAEIPNTCTKIAGWQFLLSTDQNQTENVSTTTPTGVNGQTDINFSSLTLNQQNALLTGNDLWVSEVQQPGVANFGAIRCYNDAVNGDNLEIISSDGNPFPPDIYCIAYNVSKPIIK